jgi:hypothetical protein
MPSCCRRHRNSAPSRPPAPREGQHGSSRGQCLALPGPAELDQVPWASSPQTGAGATGHDVALVRGCAARGASGDVAAREMDRDAEEDLRAGGADSRDQPAASLRAHASPCVVVEHATESGVVPAAIVSGPVDRGGITGTLASGTGRLNGAGSCLGKSHRVGARRSRTPVCAMSAKRSGTPQCSTIRPSMMRRMSITVISTGR